MSDKRPTFKDYRRFLTPQQHADIAKWWREMSRPITERRRKEHEELGPAQPPMPLPPNKPTIFVPPTPAQRAARNQLWREMAIPIEAKRAEEFAKLKRQRSPGILSRMIQKLRRGNPTNG